MLVLIAGVTGNLGQKLVRSFLSRGHQVRGLGRNPSKLDNDIQSSLESFVQSQNHYDVPALEKACEGVDAVICAYMGTPELQLEGQLLLLRAAERVGVKRYVAASWNYDWRKMSFGQHESYDMYLAFRRMVELTSEIRPIYIFTGVLAEVLFSVPGHGDFGPENHGVWDPVKKEMHVWGEGTEIWHWTTERDCAEFTAAILDREDAEDQQFWTVCSGEGTLPEMAEIYRKVRGIGGDVVKKGNLEDLRQEAFDARAKGSVKEFWKYIGESYISPADHFTPRWLATMYPRRETKPFAEALIGWFYQLFTVDRTWCLQDLDNGRLGMQTTSLEKFIEDNDGI